MATLQLIRLLAVISFLYSITLATNQSSLRGSAQDDLITELPGLNQEINFKQYSGFLKADDKAETNRFFHYWFVESQSNPSSDPMVLWLNGGPGCSSLEGFFAELGPFKVNQDTKTLSMNPYSWNKIANVLFLSSPSGVGFSYAKDNDLSTNDDDTAKSNHLALRDFFKKFPQFKKNDLYLMGESYGGVYLPTLGVLVDDDKEMNLAGIGIGNGYLDANKLGESLVFFSYYHGLYGKTLWDKLSKHCCNGNPPARGQCSFNSERSMECSDVIMRVTNSILDSGINPYNLYDKCRHADNVDDNENEFLYKYETDIGMPTVESPKKINIRERIDRQLMLNSLHLDYEKTIHSPRITSIHLNATHILRESPPCTDESTTIAYVNQPSVRKAIHIPDFVQPWDICSLISYTQQYPARPDGLAPQIKKLLNSPRKLRLLVYNGDVDMMCNFFGDEWFVDDLGQKVIKDYEPWFVDNQVAGYVKHYEGIAYMTIKGSGHMVPEDKPKESYEFYKLFLSKKHA